MTEPGSANRRTQVATGAHGMVASGHALATDAALDVLRAGGNAVDAAVCAALVLCVVCPYACTLGGDMFAVVYDPAAGVAGLNATGALAAGDAERRSGRRFALRDSLGHGSGRRARARRSARPVRHPDLRRVVATGHRIGERRLRRPPDAGRKHARTGRDAGPGSRRKRAVLARRRTAGSRRHVHPAGAGGRVAHAGRGRSR